ncbi:putative tetratricopeptide-like helical domain, DYW domain-containing protein [Medicago truncatula]|uniref:Pentatricopeptide (PPR) repeat protein n=1 Tax=Medicago truncatula TaxID=3880 RepID=G7LIP3_MEDTR|nr:pentatricopeptide repeat-containing protein At5g44230 [Medicago truncatula]AET04218.1 pentatricopeptide (PPR) repeat protein [Medicago truncatula]RHN42624.1 putative tetratricopeptide-like helical domain, DYW domain-containing protein [Medicago truncatula]
MVVGRIRVLEWEAVRIIESHCTTLNHAKQLHAHIYRNNLHQSSYVITNLLRFITTLPHIPVHTYPHLLFSQVHSPNPFLYSALIRAYARNGPFHHSIRLYTSMLNNNVSPVSFTFSALFSLLKNPSLGSQLHLHAFLFGFVNDLYVGNTIIHMYVKFGVLDCARKVFDEMPHRDVVTWTELIVAYARSGDMDSACELFVGLPVKDMVAWTSMVTGYSQNAMPKKALQFFRKMREAGVVTDEITLVGAISACAQLGVSGYADWIREIAESSRFGSGSNVFVGSALIDMYSKCGNVEEAYNVFKGMKEMNVFSYSSMIVGFAVHGRARSAIKLFYEMLENGIKPNHVTFVGLFTACSHAGMVEQGQQLFGAMKECYGVSPTADHYACMADLLGRAGHLEKALQLVQTMPMEPNGGVWGALLGASHIHGNPDVAEIASRSLFELEPDNLGNYLLLSKTYALAAKWDDVSRVRKLMREKQLRKNPGCSWVEAKNGIIHEFFAGDVKHPEINEIKKALDDLLQRLKCTGYQPKLNSVPYDIDDEGKRCLLVSHSEKLALAYGLLSTDAGSTIKIMKNLRICEDCHIVMCGASKLTGRKIIVRDNMRFHHFLNGACSCNNFW